MASAPLATRKLLARQKMRDLLLRAATSRDDKARDEEERGLRSMLAMAEDGRTAELCAVLNKKLADLDTARREAQAEAEAPTGDEKQLRAEGAAGGAGAGVQAMTSSDLALEDEERLRGCLRSLAHGKASNEQACTASLWRALLGVETVGSSEEEHSCSLRTEDVDNEAVTVVSSGNVDAVAEAAALSDLLRRDGFFVAPALRSHWLFGVPMRSINGAMDALVRSGWPPVFIYMYDEIWHAIDAVWDLMTHFLGEDCVLEPSFFAWCVAPHGSAAPGATVGSNFGLPHRDYPASEALYEDGETPKLLSVWIPVTDATLENGCMFAVPREFDTCFEKHQDQAHMRSAGEVRPGVYKLRFPVQGARALPADAGSVLCWNGNTIHWGSSCAGHRPGGSEPRKSIAMTFRRSDVAQLEGGGDPIRREDVRGATLPLSGRLSLIARSLLLYSQWYTLRANAVPPALYDIQVKQ